MSPRKGIPKKGRSKRKRTPVEKRARREMQKRFTTIFVDGKQKRVPREPLIDGIPIDEFIARNADPLWLHQCELWELIPDTDNPNRLMPPNSDDDFASIPF